jgi:tetracycline resistance efflux pump
MDQAWIVLLPPAFVLILAFITHDIVASLGVGIVTGILIASKLNPLIGLHILFKNTLIQLFDQDKIAIFLFLIVLGSIISLINITGSAKAFSDKITNKIRYKKSVKLYSIFLSFCLFIDDYLNSLTVGYIMHPLTDKFKVPRAKLAYLVDSLTGPLAILIPVSSWVATILTNLESAGINTKGNPFSIINLEPLQAYLYSLPFIFYSILTIISVSLIVIFNISFGPMSKQELIAETTGNLFGGKKNIANVNTSIETKKTFLSDFFVPLLTLLASVFFGIYVWGYGAIFLILLGSAFNSFLIGIFVAIYHKTITANEIPRLFINGYKLMIAAIITIFVANIFALILKNDLKTGDFIAQIVAHSLPEMLIPFLLFGLSLSIALATGTSWGTMALMLPIALPPLISLANITGVANMSDIPLLLPSIGAILSGAVAGDHISPISETTVMAATSSGCYLGDHITTQTWYAVPVLISTGIGYLAIGFLLPIGIIKALIYSLSISSILCVTILLTLNKFWNYKKKVRF